MELQLRDRVEDSRCVPLWRPIATWRNVRTACEQRRLEFTTLAERNSPLTWVSVRVVVCVCQERCSFVSLCSDPVLAHSHSWTEYTGGWFWTHRSKLYDFFMQSSGVWLVKRGSSVQWLRTPCAWIWQLKRAATVFPRIACAGSDVWIWFDNYV